MAIHAIGSIQGHPRSLILVPIESAYVIYYQCSIITLVLSCTVSEIRRLIGRKIAKNASSYPPQSHKSLLLGVTPFEFPDEPHIFKNWNVWAPRWWKNHDASSIRLDTIPTCDGQTDGRTERRPYRHVAVAKAALCIASSGKNAVFAPIFVYQSLNGCIHASRNTRMAGAKFTRQPGTVNVRVFWSSGDVNNASVTLVGYCTMHACCRE